jgi:hypothetical protein
MKVYPFVYIFILNFYSSLMAKPLTHMDIFNELKYSMPDQQQLMIGSSERADGRLAAPPASAKVELENWYNSKLYTV